MLCIICQFHLKAVLRLQHRQNNAFLTSILSPKTSPADWKLSSAPSGSKKATSIPASAALLHDVSSVVPREFAKSVITVNYGPVHNLGVPQQKTGFCKDKEQKRGRALVSGKVL